VKEKPITVYWSPATSIYLEEDKQDWGFLYPYPKKMFNSLIEKKSTILEKDSFFTCPAFKDLTKKILCIKSPMSASYELKINENNENIITAISENFISPKIVRKSTLENKPIVFFPLQYIFFADEPLKVLFTAPYFDKSEYTKYGSVIPGQFDIGQWFRPYNFEVQMWSNTGEFHIKEDEPLFYVHFQTDRPIIFKKFNYTEQLSSVTHACVGTTGVFGKGQTLVSRYFKFLNTGMRDKVLALIKNNLIEESNPIKI
jgi:hypothetical protein